MRKTLAKKKECDDCGHTKEEHKDDGEFYVECMVKHCDCQEYDEEEE